MLSRSVNDLRMALHGLTDQVTIQNRSAVAFQTETIQAGNGECWLNTQAQRLIQAMASFSADTGLTWEQAIVQRSENVQMILAANWQ